MRALLEILFNAQKQLLHHAPLSPEHREIVEKLREKVPPAILAHFLRMVARGQPGVALVHHGVCSACHIRIPLGTQATLTRSDDLHLCESCAAYLLVAEDPAPAAAPTPPIAQAVKRRRRSAAVAA